MPRQREGGCEAAECARFEAYRCIQALRQLQGAAGRRKGRARQRSAVVEGMKSAQYVASGMVPRRQVEASSAPSQHAALLQPRRAAQPFFDSAYRMPAVV